MFSTTHIIHAALAFIGVLGVLAGIWFVTNNRLIAIAVAIASICGAVSSLLGIYLSLLFHHYGLLVGGIATLLFYLLIMRFCLKHLFSQ